ALGRHGRLPAHQQRGLPQLLRDGPRQPVLRAPHPRRADRHAPRPRRRLARDRVQAVGDLRRRAAGDPDLGLDRAGGLLPLPLRGLRPRAAGGHRQHHARALRLRAEPAPPDHPGGEGVPRRLHPAL
ncbi:MAG: hypothetical protein AVDCRST_MAG52-2982, partial [uncultured Blastococcus sp.]